MECWPNYNLQFYNTIYYILVEEEQTRKFEWLPLILVLVKRFGDGNSDQFFSNVIIDYTVAYSCRNTILSYALQYAFNKSVWLYVSTLYQNCFQLYQSDACSQ